VEKINTHFILNNSFLENSAVYEIMWKNNVQQDRPLIIWSNNIACRTTKATTHTQNM